MEKVKTSKEQGYKWLTQVIILLSLICLGFGLYCMGWRILPASVASKQLSIPAGVLPVADNGQNYDSLTDYTLIVSWPAWVHFGESGKILANLSGNAMTQNTGGSGEQTQIVLVEPVIAGLPIHPQGLTQASLTPGQSLDLSWEVEGFNPGDYAGKLFVSFGFYDDMASVLESAPVAVIDFQIQVRALWGLEANLVLWLGLVGLMLWGVLFIIAVWRSKSRL